MEKPGFPDLLLLLSRVDSLYSLLYSQGVPLDRPTLFLVAICRKARAKYKTLGRRRSYLETQFSIYGPRLLPVIRVILAHLSYSDLCALADRDKIRDRLTAIFLAKKTALWLKRASRVAGCGKNAMLATDADWDGILVPYSCNSPVCPSCSRRRSAERFGRVVEMLDRRHRDNADFRVITFTARNAAQGDLKVALDRLHDAWRNFRRKCKGWKEHVAGYLYNVEITYSRRTPGLPWHPHIHVVAEGSYWPPAQLAAEWSAFCARAGLQACPKGSVRIEALRGDNEVSALKEVCKYTLKPFEQKIDSAAIIELVAALQGDDKTGRITRRFRGACGTLELLPIYHDPKWYIEGGVSWLLDSDDSEFWHDDDLKKALVSAIKKSPDLSRELGRSKGRISHVVRSGNLDKKRQGEDTDDTATAE